MKFLIMTLVSLCAASAMACPDLNGTYQCEKDANDSSDTGVMSVSYSAPAYELTDHDNADNSGMLPADGKVYQLDNGGTYKGSCTAAAFNIAMTGNDEQYGPYAVNYAYTKDAQGGLYQQGHVKADFGEGLKEYPFSATCTKL